MSMNIDIQKSSNVRCVIIGLASLVAAACSPLAPRADNTKYFILAPLAKANQQSATSSARQPLTVGVGPIDFPGYLRSAQIVTRTDANQIKPSAESRWAEPLDKNFERTLSENLSILLQTQRIEKYPWSNRSMVKYQVTIYVVRFETNNAGQAQLVARWIIKDGPSGNDLYASETAAGRQVGNDADGTSAALSYDLQELSAAIAAEIDELTNHRQETSSN
jgi:hypothetical protein